ncbi:hypothetical protein OAJ72_02605 [Pelagibacteraceae bacterium]|nr:hypothetical protein [Pelagibacteraceae bacterium]
MYYLKSAALSIIFAIALILTTSAEEITTGNLLPNAGDSKSSAQSVDNNIPNVASSCSEFTVNNATCFSNEIEVTGTGTVNTTGSLLNITTNSDTTTQDKLDNGITLNSTSIIQNCEWDGSSNECGDRAGARDTFKTTVKILDSNGNTLASVDQIRNTDAHYYANAHKYTDQVIYTGTGSNQFDWTWTGIDNNTNPGNLGGPNLLGASLTMTYENVVLEVETQTALNEVSNAVNTTEIEESVSVEIKEEAAALISTVQTIAAAPLTTTTKVVQVKAAIKKFESKTGATVTKTQVTTAPAVTSTNVVQSSKIVTQKKATTIAKQIIQSTTKKETINEKEEKQEEKKSEIKTEEKEKKQETKKIVSAKEETSQEEESSSTTTSTEVVSTKGDSEQKKVQSEKVKASITKLMDKVDEQVKDIAKNLEVKNLIKLDAMVNDQASLDLYNVPFYLPKDIYLDQLPLSDNRIIYRGITLSNYIVNDKVFIKEQKLNEFNLKKQRILMEIRELKNG